MILERQRMVRDAARAAVRLQKAMEEGVRGAGSGSDPARIGGAGQAPVHGSVPVDVGLIDTLSASLDIVLAEVAAVQEAMATPGAPEPSVPVTTLRAGFAYLEEHVDDVADELAAAVALTCRREHGRYARALSGAYGEPLRRCPTCERASLLPERTIVPAGRAHVLVCSTPECDPEPGCWRRYDVLAVRGGRVRGVDHGVLIGLKELSAMTGIPYRTLDSAVRRARVHPVDTGTGPRVFRLSDLLTLPALRKSGMALRSTAG